MKFNKTILFILVFCAFVSAARSAAVTVTDYPYQAIGDGSTDNRSKIQDAINDMGNSPGGGTVYFPAGYFNVSDTLVVPSNVRLQGLGSSYYNCQIRLTRTQVPLFEVRDDGITGRFNITFKDMTLYSLNGTEQWPRTQPSETLAIRGENTAGISLKSAGTGGQNSGGISNVAIENVRIMRFTRGISAISATVGDYAALIKGVMIRNYASDGNEYSLYTNTFGADGWDIQNMNVYPMYDKQNGIFLERSGKMSFLQLSCAGEKIKSRPGFPGQNPGICARLLDNGDTYFRNMHVEGPRLGFCVGSDCKPSNPTTYTGVNNSQLTIENSATGGEFHRATKLVSINNRFWLDFPDPPPTPYKFIGAGVNSTLMTCADVWVKWDPNTHITDTTVNIPTGAFPGLPATQPSLCRRAELTSVPVFAKGYIVDEVPQSSLFGAINVTAPPYNATTAPGNDDTQAFVDAIAAANTGSSPRKHIYVPAGSYNVNSTLLLQEGQSIVGVPGSPGQPALSNIILVGRDKPLFKVVANLGVVKAVTMRNLVLTAQTQTGTVGINMEGESPSVGGGAGDFQIQGVDFNNFEVGVLVQPACNSIGTSPICGSLSTPNPMFDSVSLKDADFSGNQTAILIRSQNASNWNLENIGINVPNGKEGIRIDGIGLTSIRDLSCFSSGAVSGTGAACVSVQRQAGLSIEGLTATGVANALVALWENGYTQFPVTLRNSNLTAGVYFQGRVYLNSVNNTYPARLGSESSLSNVVRFAGKQEGHDDNTEYGGKSDIFSCDDKFVDASYPGLTQSTWAYTGVLSKAITYCN